MKRKRSLLCLIVISLLFVTGCWKGRELNELAIAVALGIDKVGNQYKVSVQVVEPTEVAGKKGGDKTPVTTYQITANTIFEAIRKMTTVNPRKIYPSHLRIVVLGESLAKEGIGQALDLLSRDEEIRTDFFIVVSKHTTAENTLKVLTKLETIPAVSLFSTLQTSEKQWAPTTTVTLDQLITTLVSEGRDPVLTGLVVLGDEEVGQEKRNMEKVLTPTTLQYSGLAVFKKDKLIGWLNETESKAYNYISDEIKSTVGYVTCPQGGKITFEVIRSKTKVKGSVKDGQPQIDIEVRLEINIGEVQCSIDLLETKNIAEVERLANSKVEGFIDAAVKKVQKKYKVDIFGFGDVIHRSNPKEWRKLKKNWDHTFETMPVNVKVNHKIRHLGTVSNSFLEEMRKEE
ncbi:spore gernimation protein GerC [Paenibacillus sp. FSL A5-0031]|uniref:Ger(x)C family spore germination protein n=1 Tax=Paenibacillus sp. FSL A5-0031 TaxID=1920420 RepID=UPI00096E42CB|nr:Ger(x)C family spore germination protein [Paenibacillus sp. FSL A5-0031]OME87999.1 spore gernimation protein GerC [Paenibacillus sp. FSL A5-0031]